MLDISFPEPSVVRVTLSRPKAANALNRAMAEELADFFHSPQGAVIILTGGETKIFCAGADLKERRGMDEAQWEAQHAAFRAARDAIYHSPAPVIAAVNGAAYGGGLELALACDFIYAAAGASFALPEARLGIMPGLGGAQMLARSAGFRRASEMLLTGHAFTAQEAKEMGVVNRVFPAEQLQQQALRAASAIRDNAPLAVSAIRRSLREGADMKLEPALVRELELYQALLPTHDRHEGVNAFNEKRKPVFTGS